MHWLHPFRSRLASAGALLCLLASGPAMSQKVHPSVDYFDGLRAWDIGQREAAVGIWIDAAGRGDQRSMRRLGQCHEAGDPCLENRQVSLFWFLVAERFGDDEAGKDVERLSALLEPKAIEEARKQAAGFQAFKSVPSLRDALEAADLDAVKAALKDTSYISVISPDGMPTFVLAAASGSVEILDALVEFLQLIRVGTHLYLEASTETGLTPLHIAASLGHAPVVQRILELGVSPMIPDNNGTPAYVLAERKGHKALAATLRQAYDEARAEFDGFLRDRGLSLIHI